MAASRGKERPQPLHLFISQPTRLARRGVLAETGVRSLRCHQCVLASKGGSRLASRREPITSPRCCSLSIPSATLTSSSPLEGGRPWLVGYRERLCADVWRIHPKHSARPPPGGLRSSYFRKEGAVQNEGDACPTRRSGRIRGRCVSPNCRRPTSRKTPVFLHGAPHRRTWTSDGTADAMFAPSRIVRRRPIAGFVASGESRSASSGGDRSRLTFPPPPDRRGVARLAFVGYLIGAAEGGLSVPHMPMAPAAGTSDDRLDLAVASVGQGKAS